jgi:hypothetical protein
VRVLAVLVFVALLAVVALTPPRAPAEARPSPRSAVIPPDQTSLPYRFRGG